MRFLTAELRALLAKPQGKLLSEKAASELVSKSKAFTAAVGDETAQLLLGKKISPGLIVYDFKKMRRPLGRAAKKTIQSFEAARFRAKNPAGTITSGLVSALKRIFSRTRRTKKPAKLFVEGEEDLAVIPVILLAPPGSIVAYGQPRKGVVVMKVTRALKKKIARLYAAFSPAPPKD